MSHIPAGSSHHANISSSKKDPIEFELSPAPPRASEESGINWNQLLPPAPSFDALQVTRSNPVGQKQGILSRGKTHLSGPRGKVDAEQVIPAAPLWAQLEI